MVEPWYLTSMTQLHEVHAKFFPHITWANARSFENGHLLRNLHHLNGFEPVMQVVLGMSDQVIQVSCKSILKLRISTFKVLLAF